MKVYRLEFFDPEDASMGFEFFTSRRAMLQQATKWQRQEVDGDEIYWSRASVHEFRLTKKGVIALLKRVATHPDNG